ncbi:AsmA family protein [Aidingimonas halophila]|uniref:AsmA protein n=1 Tax=Aidingimonas halophila TaxID=574349 RepID=A0A1H2Z350_9GAMM|nr:AsmA family protein [Aidingimonas halophila]GHC15231.1 cell envelope biogenesis protein AsmA [Aidingimonas halophila]SDX11428.1 AsmA protein [Aidingimonas halophila]
MRALLRTLLAVIGVLGLVMLGAVVYVTTFFDPNDLKPRLVEVVREHSGLELTLDGPLSWSFYPRLGVSVQEAKARLPDQDTEQAFMAFSQAEVSLAFAPLLSGEIAIDGLTVDGMRLNLSRNEEGEGNWEAFLERLGERSEEAEAALAPASSGPNPDDHGGMAVALDIASVKLRDGDIRFSDELYDRHWHITGVNVGGSNVNPTSAFPLNTTFRVDAYSGAKRPDEAEEDGPTPYLSSEVSFDSRVKLGLADDRYEFNELSLKTDTAFEALEDRRQQLTLTLDELMADLATQRYEAEGGQLKGGLDHPAWGDDAMPLTLDFDAETDLSEQNARINQWRLTGEDGLDLGGHLLISDLFEGMQYSGQVSMAPMSLRPWLERFNVLPNTASDDALSDVTLTSPLQGNAEEVMLSNLTLVMDDSTFTGYLNAGLDGELLDFELDGDALDLDAYLPPPDEEGAQEESAMLGIPGVSEAYAQEEESQAELLPTAWLAALTLNGELRLGRLDILGMVLENAELVLQGQNGNHRLERLDADLYEGSLSATGSLDLQDTPPHWQLEPRLEQVQIAPLYQALADTESPLRGRLFLSGELSTQGNTISHLRRNLDGTVETRIDDGAMLATNVSRELCSVAANLEGEETTREWSEDTRFDRAQASFEIRDGVAHNDDLDVAIPGIDLGGEGQLNFETQRFDYRASARFVDTADAACDVNPRLERIPMPVRCEGELGGETGEWCRFDRDAFVESIGDLARDEAIDRASEEIRERLEEEGGKELEDALRGLLQ